MTVNAHAARSDASQTRESSIYIVKDGDFLGAIAIAHETTIEALIEANNLDQPDKIYSGMELLIPGPAVGKAAEAKAPVKRNITVIVPKGFNLSRIANVYGLSVSEILNANKKLKNPDHVKAGQSLIIPGVQQEIELVPPPPCFASPIEFYRVRTDETKNISVTFCNGKPNPAGIEELSSLSSPAHLDEVPFPLHPRLAVLLQKVAKQFPDKRIEVISGQRTQKTPGHESYHNKGQAIDFRVEGIANQTLAKYVRSLKNTGVGYYPNSVFIHMDTRDKSAFWIDYSRPGEKAIYGKAGMNKKAIASIRASRAAKEAKAGTTAESTENPTEVVASAEAAAQPADLKDLKTTVESSLQENLDRSSAAVADAIEDSAISPDSNT